MILAGRARPEQIGAFLMLLRVKEETGEEIAGFVRAVRATLPAAADPRRPRLAELRRQAATPAVVPARGADAGRRRLARRACTASKATPPAASMRAEALARLGLPIARSLDEAASQLARRQFRLSCRWSASARGSPNCSRCARSSACVRRFILWRGWSTRSTRPPRCSRCSIPATWRSTATPRCDSRSDARMTVLRGEGGEAERRPNKPCETLTVEDGAPGVGRWPPLLADPRADARREPRPRPPRRAVARRGRRTNTRPAAIVGTLALALTTLGVEGDCLAATARAGALWRARDRRRLIAAAA